LLQARRGVRRNGSAHPGKSAKPGNLRYFFDQEK